MQVTKWLKYVYSDVRLNRRLVLHARSPAKLAAVALAKEGRWHAWRLRV
jgi:hypothetical protein